MKFYPYNSITSTDNTHHFSVLPKIIDAGAGAMVGLMCVFPLDLVKTRLQSQQLGPNGEKMYKNMLDCFRKTYKSEGFFGMYRGFGSTITLIMPEKALKLVINDYARHQLMLPDGTVTMPRQILAAAITGAFQVIISTPMEFIKIHLQNAGRVARNEQELKQVKKASAMEFVLSQLRSKGIFGLYRGIGVTVYRDVGFSLIYFPVFFAANELGPRKKDGSGEAVSWVSFLAGMLAGSTSAVAVTPFDVIKTRLQTIKKAQGELEFTGIYDCFIKTLKFEGPLAFFKGGLCRMIVIAPLYAFAQAIYYFNLGEQLLSKI